MINGSIFNIQKYSVHDGPGIRTTVFFKGCPLDCWWCHNPESQSSKKELAFREESCTRCGSCEKACTGGAIAYEGGEILLDRTKCRGCGDCTDFCCKNARELIGRDISAEVLMKEIEKDYAFYEQSGGGVTFSGGEPLLQIDFLEAVLAECNKKEIHTAIDTTVYSPWESISRAADKTDLFLIDIKHMDSEAHRLYTGVPNELILQNIKRLCELRKSIYIRLPIIPGINDDKENLSKTAEFLSGLNICQVNILPYHKTGIDKYKRLQRDYKLWDTCEPTEEHMQRISGFLEKSGLCVKIGG